MARSLSRLVIAGLSGDSGKTITSLSFLAALKRKGLSVSVFKKGPDYIDPAWLSAAAGSECRNLDTFMVDPDVVFRTFAAHAGKSDISVVEGNRGLFDGRDVHGTQSTAELAKLISAPVVLVVNATKTTRTVAAIVKGCVSFDPDVNIAGIILNRVAGSRHSRILRKSIEEYCGLPVVGTVPKLGDNSALIPGRHLGLITPAEYEHNTDLGTSLRKIAENYIDVEGLIGIAETAPAISSDSPREIRKDPGGIGNVKIGYFKDSVFTFYYPENLEALEANGAHLVPVSSLADERLPSVDALYIGGGFPETHAEQLARNGSMMESVKKAATDGMPVYAECGGLIYLANSIMYNDNVYPMTGFFPLDLVLHNKPVGHGYSAVSVDAPNPFYPVGTSIRGHEFHYSGPAGESTALDSCMAVETGVGVGGARDGLVSGNTMACYTHIHANGVASWAPSFVSRAAEYAATRNKRTAGGNNPAAGLNQ